MTIDKFYEELDAGEWRHITTRMGLDLYVGTYSSEHIVVDQSDEEVFIYEDDIALQELFKHELGGEYE